MRKYYQRLICALAAVLLVLLLAAHAAWAKHPINKDKNGWAVKGYDVVAYFTLGQPARGTDEYTHVWQKAIWRFVNFKHLQAFKADPERYAPQYGGY